MPFRSPIWQPRQSSLRQGPGGSSVSDSMFYDTQEVVSRVLGSRTHEYTIAGRKTPQDKRKRMINKESKLPVSLYHHTWCCDCLKPHTTCRARQTAPRSDEVLANKVGLLGRGSAHHDLVGNSIASWEEWNVMRPPECPDLLVFLEIGLGLVLDIVIDGAAGSQSQHI